MNYFESENHRLVSTIKRARLEDHINGDADDRNRCEGLYAGSPKPKKLKLSLGLEGSQNTPSPMSAVRLVKGNLIKVY